MAYIDDNTILELNNFLEFIVKQYKVEKLTLKFKPVKQDELEELYTLKSKAGKGLVRGLNKIEKQKGKYEYIAIVDLDTLELTIYSTINNLDILYEGIQPGRILNSVVKEVNFENVIMDNLIQGARSRFRSITSTGKFKELFNEIETMRFKENNFHSAIYLTGLFSHMQNLREVYIDDCDFNDLESTISWFEGCSSLKRVSIKNCSMKNVKNTSMMFAHCEEIEDIDISSLESSTQLKAISKTFIYCYKLKNIIGLNNLKGKQIELMTDTFRECHELEKIDFSNVEFKSLTDLSFAFINCHSLKELHIENLGKCQKIRKMDDILLGTPADMKVYIDKPIELKSIQALALTQQLNEISTTKKYIKPIKQAITEDVLSNIVYQLSNAIVLNKNNLSENQIIYYNTTLEFDTVTIRVLSEADKERLILKLNLMQEPFYDMAGYMMTWTQTDLSLFVDELKLNKLNLELYHKVEYHPEQKEVILHPRVKEIEEEEKNEA